MVKVEAIIDFLDLEKKSMRKAGESFEVTEERAEKLINSDYGTLVRVIAKEEVEEEVKPKRRSKKAE